MAGSQTNKQRAQGFFEDPILAARLEAIKQLASGMTDRVAVMDRDFNVVYANEALVRVAEALLEHEVLDAPQLKQLMAGEPLAVKTPAPLAPAPPREARAGEDERASGILPPPVADPRPTS